MRSATPEGTRRFRERHEGCGAVSRGHFREFMGLHLSSLGVGTYLGDPDDETDRLVKEAVKASISSGAVNVVDTAINYRFQKAERSVGAAIAELTRDGAISRDEVFICTKNGYLTADADVEMDFWSYLFRSLIKPGVIRPEDIASGSHCMTVPYLKDQLERSLKNLNLPCVDLMYLHNAAESQIPEVGRRRFMEMLRSAFEFYESERRRGRILYYGMATWTCFRTEPDAAEEHLNLEDVVGVAEEAGGVDHGFRFIQLPYNLAMPEALTVRGQRVKGEPLTILEAARRLRVGVFTSVPLMQGRLVGHPKVPRLKGLESPSQWCIQFARSTPGVLAPLVGQKRRKHVDENLQTARVPPLSPEEFRELLGKKSPSR